MSEKEPSPTAKTACNALPTTGARRAVVLRRALTVFAGLYGLAILSVWALLYFGGDHWWLATVVLFGPRWIYAVPLPLLAVWSAITSWRLLWPLAAIAVVQLGPIMGFVFPWSGGTGKGPGLRVMTFNVDALIVDKTRLMDFIREIQPDVVLLQEVPHNRRARARVAADELVWPAPWHVVQFHEFLLASRLPILELDHFYRPGAQPGEPSDTSGVAYTLEWKGEKIRIFNLHFMTPRPGLEAVLDGKTVLRPSGADKLLEIIEIRGRESQALRDQLAGSTLPTIVAGDFNMPRDSTIFRRDWSRLSDAFSQSGFGLGYTKIQVMPGWQYGIRIDHVLFDPAWHSRSCWVGPDLGSDHLPLVADLE